MKLICHAIEKDLKDCDRDDINKIVAFMHNNYKVLRARLILLKILKNLRILFPEKDERGRIDNITPYAVRHLSIKIDK